MNATEALVSIMETHPWAAKACSMAIEEIDALRGALSSGLCSEHTPADPLHCDTCNHVTWLKNAAKEHLSLRMASESRLNVMRARNVINAIKSICAACGHTATEDGCAFCIKSRLQTAIHEQRGKLSGIPEAHAHAANDCLGAIERSADDEAESLQSNFPPDTDTDTIVVSLSESGLSEPQALDIRKLIAAVKRAQWMERAIKREAQGYRDDHIKCVNWLCEHGFADHIGNATDKVLEELNKHTKHE